jgi:hypothetical protein
MEIRDDAKKQVSFSAIDLDSRKAIFEYLTFEEPWWISLADISENILLLKVYTETNNPDKKGLIAFNFEDGNIVWWKNNFALSAVANGVVFGSETSLGMKFLAFRLSDGEPAIGETLSMKNEETRVVKPQQYLQGTRHFETLQTFLDLKYQILPESVIEYLEFGHLLIISCYKHENGLANYLIVLKDSGANLLNERIGEQLKGIGSDTFFIVAGYLIFVKNRSVLVSYKMV